MSKGFADQSAKTLKRDINIKAILQYFNIEIDDSSKCLCPFHEDKNPSMIVNDESVFCFACGEGFDIFSFVQRFQDLATFNDARKWVANHIQDFPVVESNGSRKRGEYRGPVDVRLVEYWHSCLKDEHRQVLHTKRLLTDETIDLYKIGWRPDFHAFSIPFWTGVPSQSDIAIVQFRLTEATPARVTEHVSDSKFIGLSGHNKPYFINKHLLTEKWAVMVFGTFDGLLAGQDGFPATSPNGASVFSQKKWADELNNHLTNVDTWFVVYDKTESERSCVNKMINHIKDKKVIPCEFPDGPWKDYEDYRHYKTPLDFMKEVLGWRLY